MVVLIESVLVILIMELIRFWEVLFFLIVFVRWWLIFRILGLIFNNFNIDVCLELKLLILSWIWFF